MTSNHVPQVSVLLPVYNCPDYVGAAIDSILNQSFSDFELIIIDDGSTDSTPDALDHFHDPRIRHYRQENQGLAATLNRAISLAKAPLLARQDQDDLSNPDRLEKQVAYMQANPACGLLGTWAQIMEIDKLSNRFHRHPTSNWELRYNLLFNNPFVHSSVMLRKTTLEQVGGYCTDPKRQPPEDYELWSRLSRVSDVANLPEELLIYREIPSSMSRTGISPFQQRLVLLSAENIALAAGRPLDDPAALAIAALTHGTAETLGDVPDLGSMLAVLNQAIDTIADPGQRPALKRNAEMRMSHLRSAWIAYRTPLGPMLQRQGPIRSLAKRLLNLLTWRQA